MTGLPTPTRKERKFATALFADLVGSTSLTEREDPEVVQATIGRLFDRLAIVIERYGGFIEKYMGDAILAVFGVPMAHEDDPERAVRAGLEMQAVLAEMNRATQDQRSLEMRIGVEAGDILVDLERVTGSRDRMLTGDAVNVAARLQSSAGIGRVLVGPIVHAATTGRVDYSDPEELELKGKAKPVPTYTALRMAATQAGERPVLGIEARMIGRDKELAILQQTLHRVESEGRPALVTVFAPAGNGKSRLARELLRYIDASERTFFWRSGRCLPYGATAYSGLADVIKAQCEVLESDTAEVTIEKVTRAVENLGGTAEMHTAITYLLGLSTEVAAGREQLFEMWLGFLERMAARYPLVLVIEDIHWADEGLLDFIEFFAEWATGGILILTSARPELFDKRPAWGDGSRDYAPISLDPLKPEENVQMLTELLGEAMPSELTQLIVRRAEGNPLYTEEIVRMFIDRELVVRTENGWHLATAVDEIEIPRSIHALIAARLDGLAAEEKALLQDASVVGRVFWSGLAGLLAGHGDVPTGEQLERLCNKELITAREPSSFSDEGEFGFHHSLIRDVAYDSLPKQLRAEKHSVIAKWAEDRISADREDLVELISTHYEQACAYMFEVASPVDEIRDMEAKAYRWCIRAAEHATHVWQIAGALDWYRKALRAADKLDIDAMEMARVWEAYATAAYGALDDTDVSNAYERALEFYSVAEESGPNAGRVKALQALVLDQLNDERAIACAEDAVATLRAHDDKRSLGRALGVLGHLYWRKTRFKEAIDVLEEGLEICRREGDVAVEIDIMTDLSIPYWLSGDLAGLDMGWKAYELAKEAGTLDQVLRAGNNIGATLKAYGDPTGGGDAALAHVWELSRRHGKKFTQGYVGQNLAELAMMRGRFDEADVLLQTTLDEAPPSWVRVQAELDQLWARLLILRGDLPGARARMESATSQESEYEETEVLLICMGAMVDYYEGRVSEALEALRTVVERDRFEEFAQPYDAVCALRVARDHGDQVTATRLADFLHKRTGLIDQAYMRWCDGLLVTDPEECLIHFEDAIERFRYLRHPLLGAMCLTDLARLQRDLGQDHVPAVTKAIDFFRAAGARLLLAEAEELLT